MEKKKSSGSIVFIILLIIVILGLVGYILYDKGLFTKKEVVSKEKTVNTETISFKEARGILDEFGINYLSVKDYKKSGFYFEYLVGTLNSKEEYNCDQLAKKDSNKWTKEDDYYQSKDGYMCHIKDKYPVYSYEDMNKIYKEVFNKDLKKDSFALDDLGRCNLNAYYYIKSIDGFIKTNIVGGCISSPFEPIEFNVISDAVKENNTLTITAYIDNFERKDLSITEKGFKIHDAKIECDLYNEEDQEDGETAEINAQANTDTIRTTILESYLDKVNKYEITFKIDGNKYNLDTIKKVNN